MWKISKQHNAMNLVKTESQMWGQKNKEKKEERERRSACGKGKQKRVRKKEEGYSLESIRGKKRV